MRPAFELMKPDLAAKGIILQDYSREPRLLWIGGDGGDRYKVVAKAGKTRIDTHIDAPGGTHLFPKYRPERRHGSVFFRDQEQLLGLYQTWESHASDKLLAVVLNPSTSRWKDFRDLSILQGMKLDTDFVGMEVVHKLRRKFTSDITILDALAEAPEVFAWEFALEKAQVWEKWRDRNAARMNNFTDVLCDGRHLYVAVREKLMQTLQWRKERRPRVRKTPTVEELQQMRVGIQRIMDRHKSVVLVGLPREGRSSCLSAEILDSQ